MFIAHAFFYLFRTYYESDAFMLDEEKTSTLPQMAAGLYLSVPEVPLSQ